MSANKAKLVVCPLKLPETLAQRADAEAERQGMIRGRSTIIRLALSEFLDRQENQRQTQEARP